MLEGIDIPEAKMIYEYLMLQKRAAQIDSWLTHEKDGRVHGRVITNGAVTGRMTHHSPNMAQVPSVSAPYGKECRSFWCVPEGYKLIGCDASGLERMGSCERRDPQNQFSGCFFNFLGSIYPQYNHINCHL